MASQATSEEMLPGEIISDPQQTAESVGLQYVSDRMPGISRVMKKGHWIYIDSKGVVCTDEKVLSRIKSLVLPPAWTNVWISPKPKGHLQATGIDKLGRKQYRYHSEWNKVRNETKFSRMLKFGELLPALRQQVEKDLSDTRFSQRKVLALVVSIMERTFIRIGNASYEKLYGSYGLTTMRNKHVKIEGATVTFQFKGKKGVYHSIKLQSRKLSNLVKKCRDIPGHELFQYIEDGGGHHGIDSGSVNHYLHEITGCDFTAKDFRTWAGSVNALKIFKEIRKDEQNFPDTKKNTIHVIDTVSKQLGNTRAVCKKYYIHPVLFSIYEKGCMGDYLKELDKIEEPDGKAGLTCEEKLLMKILNSAEELTHA